MSEPAPSDLYHRFTSRALDVLTAAQRQAFQVGATTVLPTHILMGLLATRAVNAIGAIWFCGTNPMNLCLDVRWCPPQLWADQTQQIKMPISPASKQIVGDAVEGARRLGHTYVGTEHLLLALCGENSDKRQVLANFGVTSEPVEAFIPRHFPSDAGPKE